MDLQPRVSQRVSRRVRMAALLVALVGSLILYAHEHGWTDFVSTWANRADPERPTVIFVVLDTVRADHLSLCGYARPTSPTLVELRERGASHTCRAYAPGSWTLPSHASFFTGRVVTERRAALGRLGEEGSKEWLPRPLDGSLPTLAEHMARRGYQTVAISGNAVVSEAFGLARGFSTFLPAENRFLSGDQVVERLRDTVRTRLDRSGPPLFLFVNLFDAHDPMDSVPAGFDWLPPQPGLGSGSSDPSDPRQRFTRGEMDIEEQRRFRARLVDLYDYGVWTADRALEGILDTLELHGWTDAGYRLVVVSDHGEMLGEHGLFSHGQSLFEPNNRVPLLALEVTPDGEVRAPALPDGPLSALHAYHLVLDGALPAARVPPEAVAYPGTTPSRRYGPFGDGVLAALWPNARDKLVWMEGEGARRFDLVADPEEHRGTGVDGHDGVGRLEALAGEARQVAGGASPLSAESEAALRAIGYLE